VPSGEYEPETLPFPIVADIAGLRVVVMERGPARRVGFDNRVGQPGYAVKGDCSMDAVGWWFRGGGGACGGRRRRASEERRERATENQQSVFHWFLARNRSPGGMMTSKALGF
jgi:hypothetical protein